MGSSLMERRLRRGTGLARPLSRELTDATYGNDTRSQTQTQVIALTCERDERSRDNKDASHAPDELSQNLSLSSYLAVHAFDAVVALNNCTSFSRTVNHARPRTGPCPTCYASNESYISKYHKKRPSSLYTKASQTDQEISTIDGFAARSAVSVIWTVLLPNNADSFIYFDRICWVPIINCNADGQKYKRDTRCPIDRYFVIDRDFNFVLRCNLFLTHSNILNSHCLNILRYCHCRFVYLRK